MDEEQGLARKLAAARKRQGLTQEELADKAGVTVRTVQRTESGESVPRPFTLKAMATVLHVPFEELVPAEAPPPAKEEPPITGATPTEADRHFLQVLCLSSFSYLVVPYIHFLIPARLLRKQAGLPTEAVRFARRLILGQIRWMVSFHGLLLLSLCWNFWSSQHYGHRFIISYLGVVFWMYLLNAVVLGVQHYRAGRLPLSNPIAS